MGESALNSISPGNAMANRTRLPDTPPLTLINKSLSSRFSQLERLMDDHAQCFVGEVFIEGLRLTASLARAQIDAPSRFFVVLFRSIEFQRSYIVLLSTLFFYCWFERK